MNVRNWVVRFGSALRPATGVRKYESLVYGKNGRMARPVTASEVRLRPAATDAAGAADADEAPSSTPALIAAKPRPPRNTSRRDRAPLARWVGCQGWGLVIQILRGASAIRARYVK